MSISAIGSATGPPALTVQQWEPGQMMPMTEPWSWGRDVSGLMGWARDAVAAKDHLAIAQLAIMAGFSRSWKVLLDYLAAHEVGGVGGDYPGHLADDAASLAAFSEYAILEVSDGALWRQIPHVRCPGKSSGYNSWTVVTGDHTVTCSPKWMASPALRIPMTPRWPPGLLGLVFWQLLAAASASLDAQVAHLVASLPRHPADGGEVANVGGRIVRCRTHGVSDLRDCINVAEPDVPSIAVVFDESDGTPQLRVWEDQQYMTLVVSSFYSADVVVFGPDDTWVIQ